jgi:5-methylcytosine-specific restriction endonuclease McrA
MNPKKLQRLRHEAYLRQDCRCFYCTLPIWEGDPTYFTTRYGIALRKAKYLQCTAEHLVAQQEGGGETVENVAAACLLCNRMRHLKRQEKAPGPEKYKRRVSQLIGKRRRHSAIDLLQGATR